MRHAAPKRRAKFFPKVDDHSGPAMVVLLHWSLGLCLQCNRFVHVHPQHRFNRKRRVGRGVGVVLQENSLPLAVLIIVSPHRELDLTSHSICSRRLVM